MARLTHRVLLFLTLTLACASYAEGQTSTYHLHKEASSTSGLFQLKSAGPDGTTLAVQSANLKNLAVGEYLVKAFDTQNGIPNVSGVIPTGSTITFTVWMNKTAASGVIFPRAKLRLNSALGTLVCTATGSTALTTTLATYTFSTTTTSSIPMTPSDRLYVWVGVNVTTVATSNTNASLNIEGTLNGNYDSLVVMPTPIPPPAISSLSTTSGPVGTSVTITGSNFGSTQGGSTVTFNGTAATPTSWSAASIAVPVPSGAGTGAVVVTVNGQTSNGVTFTVTPKINSLSPTSGTVGASVTISGTTFGATQGTSTVTLNGTAATPTSWSATSIAVPVPASATTGPVIVTVNGQASNSVTFTVTPKINSLSPTSGTVGTSVTISGTTFGATQGTSTVTFNGTVATPTSWSAASIAVPVPASATTGPVIVTVNGQASNGVAFTVAPKINSLSPTSGAIGDTVTTTGSTFGATQGTSTVTFNGTTATPTSWSATSIVAPVPSGATTGAVVVTVNGQVSNGVTFAVIATGTIAGTITRTGDGAAISGAIVEALQAGVVKASATTAANGSYTMSGVAAGIYDIRASAIGYQNKLQNGVAVAGNTTTTVSQSLDAVAPGDINYIYDELGRLVSVVTPAENATYTYDAVGNLLSVSRHNSSDISIIRFTPTSGSVGTAVTIYGTAFSATASQNTVTFNGVTATVISASSTQIIAAVPAGATTGPIAVTSPAGTATSSTPFAVGDPDVPTITGFIPTMATGGTAVTISGTNYDTNPNNDKVKFNVGVPLINSVTPTNIATTVPLLTGSGRISVATPAGTAVSSTDFYIPPLPYTPTDIGYTGRMTLGGSATLTISTAGKKGMVLFDATKGQRMSLKISNVTIGTSTCCSTYVSVLKPDGTALISPSYVGTGGSFFDTISLATTGTYTIFVDPQNSSIGSMTLNLYNVADVFGTIIPGGQSLTLTTTTPGQNGVATFIGTANQRVSLKVSGVSMTGGSYNWVSVSIKKADGTTLTSSTFDANGGFIDVQTLSVAGTYTILVDPWDTSTGSVTLTLYDVPADFSSSVTPGGSPVTVTTTTAGQNGQATFNGAANQQVSLSVTGVTLTGGSHNWVTVSIKKPDGSTWFSTTFDSSGGFIDVQTLTVAGTYTILVDPWDTSTGNVTLTLYDVPTDAATATNIGAPAVSVTTTVPGQNAQVTFAGTSGQQITVHITNNTMSTVTVKLLKPDGTVLTSSYNNASSFDLAPQTLSVTGTYTISIDPDSSNTGSMSVSVTNP